MGLRNRPSQNETKRYIDDLTNASADLHRSYLKDVGTTTSTNLRTPQEKLMEANLLQTQVTNVMLNEVIHTIGLISDQLSTLIKVMVKRRDK